MKTLTLFPEPPRSAHLEDRSIHAVHSWNQPEVGIFWRQLRWSISLGIMLSFDPSTVVAQNGPRSIVSTKVAEDLYVCVYVTTNGLPSNRPIDFAVMTQSNEWAQIYMLKDPYRCDLRLRSENGTSVPVTRLGAQFGSRFYALPTEVRDAMARRRGSAVKFGANRESAVGQKLPAPSQLFQIQEPGKYVLQVRFQVVLGMGSPPNYTYKPVRSPAIEVPVVAPADSETEKAAIVPGLEP